MSALTSTWIDLIQRRRKNVAKCRAHGSCVEAAEKALRQAEAGARVAGVVVPPVATEKK